MAYEPVNIHVHEAPWYRSNWEFFTDHSVDAGMEQMFQASADGIDADEAVNFIRTATDYDQMTFREARMINAVLQGAIPNMTLEAKHVTDAFDTRMRSMITNLHDDSDEQYANYFPEWIGTGRRTGAGDTVLEGEALYSFVNDLHQVAHPEAVDWAAVLAAIRGAL
jgi:hypothetical protein